MFCMLLLQLVCLTERLWLCQGLVKGSKDIRTQIRNAEERSAYVRATSEKGRDMMTLLNAGLAAPEQATQPPSEANGAAEDTPTIPCSKAASLQAVPQAAVSLLSIEARCFRETGRHFDQVMDSAVQHSEIPADSKQQLRLHQQEYLGSLFAMLDVDMGICVGQELSAAVRRAFSKVLLCVV